jgi:hypothetical protein
MKLKPIASNMTEIETQNATVLFSYKTPVAAQTPDGLFRTECRWSQTTTRHINKWLNGAQAIEKPQSFFDALV